MFNLKTDLAIEAGEIFKEQNPDTEKLDGVKSNEYKSDNCLITEVIIESENGEKLLQKPKGTYITIESNSLTENNITAFDEVAEKIKEELSKLLDNTDNKTVLVAGLGNREITPDSIGPKVVSHLLVTRHIFSQLPEFSKAFSSVCAIAPGVLGITGIETAEILKGIIDKISPDIVIIIDALAARKLGRVCTTIQMCNCGITPGSGVLNSRKALNRETLGIPTIAIGVPMVVDAATMLSDCLNITEKNKEKHDEILKSIINSPSYMICPKDVDALSDRVSSVLAKAINMALQQKLSEEEIYSLTAK